MNPPPSGPFPAGGGSTFDNLDQAILNTTANLIVVLDTAGRVVRFNAACQRLTGRSWAEVEGQVLWPFVLPAEVIPRIEAAFRALGPSGMHADYENQWLDAHGELHLIRWSNSNLSGPDGDLQLVVATGTDITVERRAEQARIESEARFRALFEGSADGVVLIDPHDPGVPWRIVDCNDAFCLMNGYPREALIGESIDLLHDDEMMRRDGPRYLEWIRSAGNAWGEGTHRRRDGSSFPIESASSLVALDGHELILGLDRDISERKQAEANLQALTERLQHEAHHDPLTGLPNRTLLTDRLNHALARGARTLQPLAVVFLDLDGFKRINDTLGHDAGDALLKEVATRLQSTLRPSDTVARLGGDEFVVLVTDLSSPTDAARTARRLQTVINRPITLGGQRVTVQASLGISVAPQDGKDAGVLLRQADLAMYQAKREGKNDLRFFAPELNAAAMERLDLEIRLKAALESGALELHYQPQFGVQSGELVGIEALLRWSDPELGPVSPDRIIPIAEDTGLIVPLGAWVLETACRQAAVWGFRVPVAVNVSPAQLIRPDFVETVRQSLNRHGMPGAALKLEITERLAVRDSVLIARHLEEVRQLGVRVSLDDFGAGHSGIASLLHWPLDELKIDRSVIVGLGQGDKVQRVVAALLALARGLELPVIAEGVETPLQLDILRSLGCETVQGYLTGRPSPPETLTALLGSFPDTGPTPS
ncbi:putative bifunctional diguanylate cyclase/phosphodiesterase [Deinococcus sp. UYEF24]